MPITYNGIGTRYHGSRDAIAREGHCSSCGRLAVLTSYETTLFFVVLFIPVIPLGKKRIIDQCSQCRRHYVLPLQTYVDGRAKDYAEAERLMAAATADVEAIAALRLVLNYREVTTIRRLVGVAEAKFPESPTLHLFTAETRRFLSEYRAAEASTERALALREDPAVREELAIFQFARNDVDAGRATLAPLFASPTRVPAAGIAAGADALQRLGRHREALELMNQLPIDGAPQPIVKRFEKLRAVSERTLERSLVDPDKFEIKHEGAVVHRKRDRFAKAKWAAAVIGGLAVAYAAYSIFLGASRRAFLVNGTERAYTATVNGRAYPLRPHEVLPIRVAEGDIAMSIAAPGYLGAPTSFHFATRPLTRPFDGDVLVLNPDGTAGVFTGQVLYASRSSGGGGRPDDVLHTGNAGYVFEDVDYAFTDPPKTISLQNNDVAVQKRIAYLDTSPMSRLIAHLNEENDARARAVASRALQWPVLDADEAETSIEALDRDDAIAALKPRTALRPIEIEAHRWYQNLRDSAGESEALGDEYRAMLDAEPESGTLMYLVGRTLGDPDDALAMYQRALDARPPEPMASVGRSYVLEGRGDFEGALAAIQQARQAMPTRDAVQVSEWELLLATHRYADALKTCGVPSDAEPYDVLRRRLETTFAFGGTPDADAMLARRLAWATKRWGAKDAETENRMLRASVAYLRHQEVSFGELCTSDELPGLAFAAAISKRDLPSAEKELAKRPSVDENSAILMYLAADAAGQRDVADRWLKRSIETLRKARPPLPKLAGWLAGEREPDEAELIRWPVSPPEKAIACAALAAARPSLASRCVPVAERFNYRAFFPHELLVASLARHR